MSEAQQNASRENGKHSNGPVTPEGKARSSKNAMKHGLYSSQVVLSNESQDRYNNLVDKYIAAFKPAGQPEYDLVIRMVNTSWRLRRIWDMETALISAEYAIIEKHLDATFDHIQPAQRAAEATLSIVLQNAAGLEHIRKHEEHLDRQWHRALNGLIKLQTLRLGRKPVLEYSPDSIEPDDFQNNFEEPETFSFTATFTGEDPYAGPPYSPYMKFTNQWKPPQPNPQTPPKAA